MKGRCSRVKKRKGKRNYQFRNKEEKGEIEVMLSVWSKGMENIGGEFE